VTLVRSAVGGSGPVESVSRYYGVGSYAHEAIGTRTICRHSFALAARSHLCDLKLLLIACWRRVGECWRRAGVVCTCQRPSELQNGSSNPEATSDLLSRKDPPRIASQESKESNTAQMAKPIATTGRRHRALASRVFRKRRSLAPPLIERHLRCSSATESRLHITGALGGIRVATATVTTAVAHIPRSAR
jgi:hypothetical protein